MGKYAATRVFQNDRKRSDGYSAAVDGLMDYLYEVPDNESQYKTQSFLAGVDPTGIYSGMLETRDATNFWNDYFKNTGLTWSDIKYPTMMKLYSSLGGGNVARSGFNFVSRNVHRLYGK